MTAFTYSAVTPAKNEADNLPRLAAALAEQELRPLEWVIVENGSSDETAAMARELAREHPWIHVVSIDGAGEEARGAPVVRAFHAGVAALRLRPDAVVKLDADVSFDAGYFRRLTDRFVGDASLGLASGTCLELRGGGWQEEFCARSHARGATRMYRWQCLEEVLPLEERMGWDGIDELKARVRGWRTTRFDDLVFLHHRPIGVRERGTLRKWLAQGEMSHYMGYRFSYLLLRAVYRSRTEPAALALPAGFLWCAIRRRPRYGDDRVVRLLREEQSARNLPLRFREIFAGRSR